MQTGVKIYIASILNIKSVHSFIHFGPIHLGMASHPLTVNNMQEKMSQSFDKNVLVWKNKLVESFSEKKFLEEVVEAQHNTGVDDAMELCTINLNKDAVQSCESYTEEVYNKCMSKLPASESKVYDVEVLNIISSCCNNHERRYRYISQVVILLSCKD